MAEKNLAAGLWQKSHDLLALHKFALLLGSLVLLFLFFPFLEKVDIGRHLFIVATTLILFIGIWVVSDTRRNMRIALAIGIPTILLNWAADFIRDPSLYYASQLFMFVAFVFTGIVLFGHIFRARRVTYDEVLGAISVYVLIGMAFASIYLLADKIEPGSFVINTGQPADRQLTYSDYMYYSLGTITTSGSGNIVEIGPFVRSLSMIEAVIGVFYVAFIISKLVSSFENSRR